MDLSGFSFDISSMLEASRPDSSITYDLLILGGGPAAMTAAVYAARKLMKAALITKDIGGQMGDTSLIENYMGFQTISGRDLVARFKEQVEQFDIPIEQNDMAVEVRKEGDIFHVRVKSGAVFKARTVILATGKRVRPLDVPGEKELTGKGVAYCSICDAPLFKGKRVVVAGGGNSAFTAALDLLKLSATVTLINIVEGWNADEIMVRAVTGYEKVTLWDLHQITAIEGKESVTGVRVRDLRTGKERTIQADGVFVEIGSVPNTECVRGLALINEKNELVVDCRCRTNVEGLFGAGDVTTVPYKQIVISSGEGAKAALAAYEYLTRGML